MNRSILAISIGPVQEFISAARRTRDLWFGSYLLSELSKSIASAIAAKLGVENLIFPAPDQLGELKPNSDLAVANIILAQFDDKCNPVDLVAELKSVASNRWREFAETARQKLKGMDRIREDVWADQIDDVLEFYAAWAPMSDTDYQGSRQTVMRLLAGRKSCRDFLPAKGRAGLPKSSLDGRRETVLKESQKASPGLPLATGEQLDVIGLVKRIGGGKQSYPSVARVAADPWLRALAASSKQRKHFEQLLKVCRSLQENDFLNMEATHVAYKYFPYDGECVYISRHQQMAEEIGGNVTDLHELTDEISAIYRTELGEPSPYLAVLVADGDRIGKLIGSLTTCDQHRIFSRSLASFSRQAKRIAEDHHGVCVYAGGDDVLALVPVDQAVPCARLLHDTFEQIMASSGLHFAEGSPTLSVGIAIGHLMEPLEDLLAYGRAAEKSAKEPCVGHKEEDSQFGSRNGFCIQIVTRGGSPLEVRERWLSAADSLDRRLLQLSVNDFPNKLPYDLRQMARSYVPGDKADELLQAELRLILKRKGISSSRSALLLERVKCQSDLQRLSNELIIAQWLDGGIGAASTEHSEEKAEVLR